MTTWRSVIIFVVSCSSLYSYNSWKWDEVDYDQMNFPKKFLWGVATAEYQNSGADNCPNNNWAGWEESFDEMGNPRIKEGQKSKKSTDHWNNFKDDVQLLKELGVNSYRFSIEWSKVEPEKGNFDEKALKHYKNMITLLRISGITPMATLFHFTIPKWFEEMGGFENEENIEYFVRFCANVFNYLKGRVLLWNTINEPALYAFVGYVLGKFPPGKKDLAMSGKVLKNLLIAHCRVYNTIKALPEGKRTSIGIVHNVLKFQPYYWWNPVEYLSCYYLSHMTNDVIMQFFKTGKYEFYVPLYANVKYIDELAPATLDFIGLNYYSHPLLKMHYNWSSPLVSSCYENEEMADMPYRLYPEGLYQAIAEFSNLEKPIYITENGIPDKSDTKREEYIKRYLYSMSEAIKDGYDVRGYYYWTLMDNFEWDEGYLMKFGLYEVDFKTDERRLRSGAKVYPHIIKQWKEKRDNE